MQYVVDYE
ncbi:2cdad4e5-aaa6-4378-b396-f7fe7ff30564 [Thermothielavioides terrestris]|uniref:2cdad4e5-aaa6-4378-b396-f7fe7ff30564 n=1 Tax=Thermothielavioides terrestris TaxID=2587410 RepID=A0A3S4F2D3_9PEZI|nr:2cdad4e5-aaa6-4378-b396-f7fe7ff30564 [Thermothielavioides terrestris]